MEAISDLVRLEVWHQDFNLQKKDNRGDLPAEKAVFGIFGIVEEQPVNCRYIGETDNLREAVYRLFDHPPGEGMRIFMQGPWIKMLQYELLPGSGEENRKRAAQEWTSLFSPNIDEEGEYPGYYE